MNINLIRIINYTEYHSGIAILQALPILTQILAKPMCSGRFGPLVHKNNTCLLKWIF